MLLRYETLSRKPRIFRKLTGMTLYDFNRFCEQLYGSAKKIFNHLGRPPVLSALADKLTALLIHYRCYVTHEFIGYFVGLDNSNISRLFSRLEPLVARKIHIKKDRRLTEDTVKDLLIDATEQPIQRPQKKKARKTYYSGKKKKHTLKIEMMMQRDGKIVNLSQTRPGREHDFTLRQKSDPLPKRADKYVDLGYQGLDKICQHVKLPYKKTKGKKLTVEQQQYNREHSRFRIAIEHKFAELKKFRILGEVYRNFRKKHHLRFNIIAGIVNLQHGF